MTTILDWRAIRQQVVVTNEAAKGFDGGRLLLRAQGVDPARPQPLQPYAEQFAIGAVDPMTEMIMRLNRERGRNVGLSPLVFGPRLGETLGTIGFAVTIEAAVAATWVGRVPIPPTAVLIASDAVTVIYLLDRVEPVERVAKVAEYVRTFADARIADVWPIAGSRHYPASGEAGLVELHLPWRKERCRLEELTALVAGEQSPRRVRLDAIDPAAAAAPDPASASPGNQRVGAGEEKDDGSAGLGTGAAARCAAPGDILVELAELTRVLGQRYRRLEIGSDVEIAQKIGRELVARFGPIPYAEGSFWLYNQSHWMQLDPDAMRRLLHAVDGAVYATPTGKPEAVRLGKARIDSALRELSAILAEPNFFTEPATGINVANGFLQFDPEDGTPSLTGHSPDQRCRHVLPGAWDKWLDEAAEDPPPDSLLFKMLDGCFRGDADADDKRRLVAELAGAAATGRGTRLRQPKAIILDGRKANNGKSQALDVLRGMLPPGAAAALSASKFSDDRHIVHLAGKLLNAPDELSSAAVIASDAFKKVVTGNPVNGRDVYKSAVTFKPMALHVFATNTLPSFTGGFDRGVQRRLLPLVFERVIPPEEQIEELGQRIAREEADLLVALAVAGARRLLRNRCYTVPESSRRALTMWLYSGDPVLGWVRARLRPDDRERYPVGIRNPKSAEAFADFHAWAKAAGYRENLLPAVNGFTQRVNANADFVTLKHTNTGGRLLGCVICDPGEEEEGNEETIL